MKERATMSFSHAGKPVEFRGEVIGKLSVRNGAYDEPEFSLILDKDHEDLATIMGHHLFPESRFEVGEKIVVAYETGIIAEIRTSETADGINIQYRVGTGWYHADKIRAESNK